MTRNQLPDGVGKKIVEALKRQAEADITPISQEENNISANVPLTDINNIEEVNFSESIKETVQSVSDNVIVEEEPINITSGVYQEKKEELPLNNVITPAVEQYEQPVYKEPVNVQNTYSMPISDKKVTIPPNVATLKNLIASLPSGVSKQTGAQIIRQTIEAMGLPMTNVLKEAQGVQDELKSSTRECMIKIQEYKTQILQLENSVQDYQKNISQINDIISLFLLTENK